MASEPSESNPLDELIFVVEQFQHTKLKPELNPVSAVLARRAAMTLRAFLVSTKVTGLWSEAELSDAEQTLVNSAMVSDELNDMQGPQPSTHTTSCAPHQTYSHMMKVLQRRRTAHNERERKRKQRRLEDKQAAASTPPPPPPPGLHGISEDSTRLLEQWPKHLPVSWDPNSVWAAMAKSALVSKSTAEVAPRLAPPPPPPPKRFSSPASATTPGPPWGAVDASLYKW